MTTFLDTINDIDIPESGDLPLGSITWMHGNKAGKTPGAFFGKATEFSGTPSAPWKQDDRFDDDPGYSAPALRIAFICWRAQWYRQDTDGPKVWLPDYQDGARKQVEYICFAEGVDDPIVLSLAKFTKAKPIQDIVKDYRDGLLRQASRLAKKGLPLWSFWIPIAGRTKDGKSVYEEVQRAGAATGAFVTYPVATYPENPMDALFVGEELLRRGAVVARTYGAWVEQRRLPGNIVEGEVLSLPAPKNPVEEVVFGPDGELLF
jgi:hypothetical protein